MDFCRRCGRQRSGNARFCGGCGTEFSESATASETPLADAPVADVPPSDATRWDPRADVTRWDPPVDATRWDPPQAATRPDSPPAEPDPFASWFAPQAPDDPAYASPTQQLSAAQPPVPGYQPPPQGPVPLPPRSSGGRKAAFLLTAVLVVLAAGGGAYLLVSRSGKHSAAQSPAHAAVQGASSAPSGSASASQPASASPSPSTSPSATPAPKLSPSLVSVAPGAAANPAEPQVETVLTHYFQGIDTHNYTLYASALDAQEQANQPKSSFDSGYATTSDSGIRLTSIADTGNGGLTATVTFTSHQAPADSVDKSACNKWTLNLYLIPSGTGYVIGQAPPGYQPTYSDC